MNQQHVHAEIARMADSSLEAVRDYLRVPSFSDTGEGMAAAAAYTRDLLAEIAPDAAVIETPGYPVVHGTVRSRRTDAPTLLVYGLYDVTPTIAEEWTVDPAKAEIVDAKDIGVLPHLGPVLVGRGANNHKGPVLSAILAIKALLATGGDVPANLVFVIEGEEEIGSPNLAGFVARHRQAWPRIDGVWLPCMQQNSAGIMTVRRAFKGSLFAELECRGGAWGGPRDGRHVWAGNSAWMDAPLMQLVRALASLYDDQQRVVLDGVHDRVSPPVAADDPEVLALQAGFDANPQWEQNMLYNLHADKFLGGKRLSHHLPTYMLDVTLNIQGITGGYQGPTFYTMMPGRATAKVDFRFPPGISPGELGELVQRHLDARGYDGVRVVNARGYAGSPGLPETANTLLRATRQTAARYGIDVAVWPIANNCWPAALFTELDESIPVSIAGAGHGDRAHAPDEYITTGSVEALMHWTVDYLADWAAIVSDAERSQ